MKKLIATAAIGVCALLASAHPIDFDKIKHWTGEGPNRAALVIQYNGDTYGDDAYVWGYRWADGESPTGETMFKAICANSNRLSLLTQYTGNYGSTVAGVGMGCGQKALRNAYFDFEKAKTFEFVNFDYYASGSIYGQTEAPGDNTPALAQGAIDAAVAGTHVIQHPLDYTTYGYPAYDYDCWMLDADVQEGPASTDNKWRAAWYEGYWSYWCSNKAADELAYSGSGFSGRTLTDGAVDGWSFTQFEKAMVGGMGEGIAPCGGAIVYMPDKSPVSPDATKTEFSVGEGANELPVVIAWGDRNKLDNLVYSYHFSGEVPTAGKIASDIAAADPRLKVVMAGESVRALTYDADDDGTFDGITDPTAEGVWTLTEYEDVIALHFGEFNPEYFIYRPAKPAEGNPCICLPDAISRHLSDDTDYLPIFVQRQSSGTSGTFTFYRRNDNKNDNDSHSNNSSDIISSVSIGATVLGKLSYKGNKTGTVYIHARLSLGNKYYSNVCAFTLLEPEKPITGLSFAYSELDMPLNSTIDNPLTIEPADATYTKLTYKSSDTKVATVSAKSMKTNTTAGTATITVSSTLNPEVSASFTVTSSLKKPVTDLILQGAVGNEVILTPKQMIGIICDTEPADADIRDIDVKLEGNGTDKSNYIASMYKVNYWDENNTRTQFYELSGHRIGECKLTVTSKDGSNVAKEYTVRVVEPDRTPLENGYTDGTIILNEEWFSHTNGGLNYITPEGEMIYQAYERENPGMSFGATSQYGIIWAGKLIVASKQAVDGGDPLPGGGRLVVADAATLKRTGSIDDLMVEGETKSGDGRAVAGATPSKVYVGTSSGIYIVDIDNCTVIGKVKGEAESDGDLYSGQIGDMVNAAGHVFAIKQSAGTFIIDTATDIVVKTIPDAGVQGITMSADGNVWIATVADGCSRFVCIDPTTLEEKTDMSVTIPASYGVVACSWGAWRTTQFFGCQSENSLWFLTGASGIAGGSNGAYYRWRIGSDPTEIDLVFDLKDAKLQGSNSRVTQKTYGTSRYDDRSGEFIVMTTEDSSSGHYRYNWTHFVDPEKGEIVRTIALRPYYWFQSVPIFPDRYDAQLSEDFNGIEARLNMDEVVEVDLHNYVTDPDNIDANISFSETASDTDEPTNAQAGTTVAEITLNGSKLSVKPLAQGSTNYLVDAQSNGRVVTLSIPVKVSSYTGITDADDDARSINVRGNRVYINGYAGTEFAITAPNGYTLTRFIADSDNYVGQLGFAPGVYILSAEGVAVKIALR